MAEKICFIEYIGKVYETKIIEAAGKTIKFAPNEEWGGLKVAVVDPATAAELLRFPMVFREVDVREMVKTESNQEELPIEKISKSPEEFKKAMATDRERREQRHKKGKKR